MLSLKNLEVKMLDSLVTKVFAFGGYNKSNTIRTKLDEDIFEFFVVQRPFVKIWGLS
jgi:hypothetical protein